MAKKEKKVPTQEQIDAEIKWLRENKKKIPSENFFGESNWKAIEAQIAVLEGQDEADNFSKEYCEGVDEEFSDNTYSEAVAAEEWVTGELPIKESPSNDWKEMVRK